MELLTVKLLNFLFIASFLENTAHLKTNVQATTQVDSHAKNIRRTLLLVAIYPQYA